MLEERERTNKIQRTDTTRSVSWRNLVPMAYTKKHATHSETKRYFVITAQANLRRNQYVEVAHNAGGVLKQTGSVRAAQAPVSMETRHLDEIHF